MPIRQQKTLKVIPKEDNWTDRGSTFAPPETGADLGTGEPVTLLKSDVALRPQEKLDT